MQPTIGQIVEFHFTNSRRKPKNERKESSILIRLTKDQKATLKQAAERLGLGVSGWILSVALREASTMDGRA